VSKWNKFINVLGEYIETEWYFSSKIELQLNFSLPT